MKPGEEVEVVNDLHEWRSKNIKNMNYSVMSQGISDVETTKK